MVKTRKILNIVFRILFNITAFLLGLTIFLNAVGQGLPALFDMVFGGGTSHVEILDGEAPTYYQSYYNNVKQLKAMNNNVGTAVEAEGAVLLENDELASGEKALPLATDTDVSLFGVTAYAPVYTIGGAGHTNLAREDRVMYREVFEDAGLNVNSTLASWYQGKADEFIRQGQFRQEINNGLGNSTTPINRETTWSEINGHLGAIPSNSTAIMFIGRAGTEALNGDLKMTGGDSTYGAGDYLQLNTNEIDILRNINTLKSQGTFDRIVLIINSPSPIQLKLVESDAYDVDAVLWVGSLGTSGIWAIGDILVGNVTPSGRLSDVWYKDNALNPVQTNWAVKDVVYQEGVYLGYRYTETRYEDKVLDMSNVGDYDYNEVVKYPFGYGLSYTTFDYKLEGVTYQDTITVTDVDNREVTYKDVYDVQVKVTNSGKVAGKEVVQVYLQQPYTQHDVNVGTEKPSVELVGFAKTSKLDAGASETVHVYVSRAYFASYDRTVTHVVDGKTLTGTFYLEAGDYYLTVAKDSHDAVNNILATKGKTVADGMTKNGNSALVFTNFNITQNDADTYGLSKNTDYEVKNLFDNADPRYVASGNSVTFVTRSNWNGTVKLAYNSTYDENTGLLTRSSSGVGRETVKNAGPNSISVAPNDSVAYPNYGINNDPNAEGHLNLIDLLYDADTENGTIVEIAYDDPRWEQLLDQLTWEETLTLVTQGRRHTEAIPSIGKPLTIDHNGNVGFYLTFNGEGMNSTELGGFGKAAIQGLAVKTNDPDASSYPTGYPCEGIIASTFNTSIYYYVGQAMGEDSLWTGISGLYGFGLNLHRSPYHCRYAEYYSEDPYLTGIAAGYETIGARTKGLTIYNKHLVMNDQDTNRSGTQTWAYEQTIRQLYLRPFEIACEICDGMMNVMSAFNRIGNIWSGSHYNLMTEWLRNEAGMRGFAITDWYPSAGMDMKSGIIAGQDLPDGPSNDLNGCGPGTGYGEVAWAMRESAHRILYMVLHSNVMNGFGDNYYIWIEPAPWTGPLHNVSTAVYVTFGVVTAVTVGLTVWDVIMKHKKKKTTAQ